MRTRSGPDHLLVYLSPFKYTVWVCIVAVLPISTIAMWFIFNWAPKERIPRPARSESNGTIHREPITDKDTSGMAEGRYEDGDSPQGFLVLLLMTFGIQCQQSRSPDLRSHGEREREREREGEQEREREKEREGESDGKRDRGEEQR